MRIANRRASSGASRASREPRSERQQGVAPVERDQRATPGYLATIRVNQDGFLFLDPEKFAESFAADLPAREAAFMADSQVPWGVEALNGAIRRSRLA
jgi:hypothetical protein